jgi:hypothetical protein
VRTLSVTSSALVALLGMLAAGCAGSAPPAAEHAADAAAAHPSDPIESAMTAGPASIAAEATVLDWNLNVLRQGTNAWTCLPDRPDTEGPDPWCVDDQWLGFLKAYVGKTAPNITRVGFAYMLSGDSPVSNSDPFATEPTGPEDWVTDVHAHIMIAVPDPKALEGISTDHRNGGPWVMWPNTPYAHLMVPVDSR